MPTYSEDFNDGPGGWIKVIDNWHVAASLPAHDGALWSYGPWWVDYNHAPPGAGYLQLLACLKTRGPIDEVTREVGGTNRFVAGAFPKDFTNAKITVRIRGELEPADAHVCLLIQGMDAGICSGWALTAQPIAVQSKYVETTLVAVPDARQWTPLGARHDRQDYYGVRPLETILKNVDVNIYLVLFPVHPKPMGPIVGDPHLKRAGRDYPIWPSSITQGYVVIDRIQIDFQAAP